MSYAEQEAAVERLQQSHVKALRELEEAYCRIVGLEAENQRLRRALEAIRDAPLIHTPCWPIAAGALNPAVVVPLEAP